MCRAESGRVIDLKVSAESSDTLLVRWLHPTHSNGLVEIYLMRYRLTGVGDCPLLDRPGGWSRLLDIDSSQLETVISDLMPYSHYQVKVWARTSAGRGQVAVVYATTATAGFSLSVIAHSIFHSHVTYSLAMCLFLCFVLFLCFH